MTASCKKMLYIKLYRTRKTEWIVMNDAETENKYNTK